MRTLAALVVAAGVVVVPSAGLAQGTQTLLTVNQTATAQAPAQWAEVRISLSGSDETAAGASTAYRDAWDRTVLALGKAGIDSAAITGGAPSITSTIVHRGDGVAGRQWRVTGTLKVRITKVDPATVYDDVCALLDSAGDSEDEGNRAMQVYYSGMETQQGPVVFGVDDPTQLQEQAVADALRKANSVATLAAKGCGKSIGRMTNLSVSYIASGTSEPWNRDSDAEGPKPAHASVAARVSVTYALVD